jgi:hypothetical protein
MGLYRGDDARPQRPIHHVAEAGAPTGCDIRWQDLPFLDMATPHASEVTCPACRVVLFGRYRVVRTLTTLDGPVTIATGPISRQVAMARWQEMVGWGMDRVRVLREEDYQRIGASR